MPDVNPVSTIEQLALMHMSGRIDLFITDKYSGTLILKKMKLNDTIKALTPPLTEKIELYHYIHQKHKDLVPKIEKVLQKMIKSGELDTLRNKFDKELQGNLK